MERAIHRMDALGLEERVPSMLSSSTLTASSTRATIYRVEVFALGMSN